MVMIRRSQDECINHRQVQVVGFSGIMDVRAKVGHLHSGPSAGRDLTQHLPGLFGHVLYIQADSGKCRREVLEPCVNSIRYSRLDAQPTADALLELLGAKHNGRLRGVRPESIVRQWAWFQPDPVGMAENEIERLVQRREMKPLWVKLHTFDGWCEEIRVFVVPKRVLARPADPELPRGYCGEPWCHRCNETFFWDPNITEVPSYPVGLPGSFVQGVRCLKCGHTAPAQLVPFCRQDEWLCNA